jgi:hypothetical protein
VSRAYSFQRAASCEGLDAWPEDLAGRAVVVTGRLERRGGTSCVHEPVPCQGVAGEHDVLLEARWQAR